MLSQYCIEFNGIQMSKVLAKSTISRKQQNYIIFLKLCYIMQYCPLWDFQLHFCSTNILHHQRSQQSPQQAVNNKNTLL